MNLGIEKVYKTIKRVRKKLILNDKVVDYLYDKLIEGNYVLMLSTSRYEEVTKDLLRQLLNDATRNVLVLNKEMFAVLSDDPEYDGVPFEVTHASPYDHRWEGDYDEEAYDDWKIDTICLQDLFYDDPWDDEGPIYAKHPEMFDFEDEEVILEKEEKLDRTFYYWEDRK